ncbi:UNKNOWN [Stylonychia lemnae]|uniref:Uncharacterized protein n=1 Tax=Stylonychia lemnae TaxID=5949 RepID=A0A078AAN9_STYLE|nr:UNKNOWN [Stylonychia lemnae]|eukprot:CDW78901.1 UNKNOWN [Stylonychia lemnae]
MPHILGIKQSTGEIFFCISDVNESGNILIFSKDLSEIVKYFYLSTFGMVVNAVYFHQSSQIFILMGILFTQDDQYSLFVSQFNEPDTKIASYILNADVLVKYQIIIPQIAQ